MPLSVEIDLSDLLELEKSGWLARGQVDAMAMEIGKEARSAWYEAAASTLTETRGVYLSALGEAERSGKGAVTIELDTARFPLAGWVEEGLAPFELSAGSFSGAKVSKDGGGLYFDVPMMRALGGRSGNLARAFAQKAGRSIRTLGQAESADVRGLKAGGFSDTQLAENRAASMRNQLTTVNRLTTHTRNRIKNEPMPHQRKAGSRSPLGAVNLGSGQSMTWHRLSSKTGPWLMPGFEAYEFGRIADDVARDALFERTAEAVNAAVSAFVSGISLE